MATTNSTTTPDYWSVDPATLDMWVAELGYAAAGKLAIACATYFLHGTEPDDIKLTKSARNMFEAERPRLDRRRALALKGGKSCRSRKATNADIEAARADIHAAERRIRDAAIRDAEQHAANVENSEDLQKVPEKSEKSSEVSTEKPSRRKAGKCTSTSGNDKPRLATVISLNPNHNPQTPTAQPSARGSGTVSSAELASMLERGLGYDSPGAYGMAGRARIVAGG